MHPQPARVPTALEQIEETYEHLDRWRARSTTIEQPEPGSDLDGDIAIWPGFPPHEVARVGLMSSVQHLNLARAALAQREAFPMAHPSVLRGALLGSSRAVWLLAPADPHERQQRALRTIWETHRRLLHYLHSDGLEVNPDGLAFITAQKKGTRALWRKTPTMDEEHSPPDTDIVKAAALVTYRTPAKQAAVPALWKQMSGDAHGLPWPMLTRETTQRVPAVRRPGDRRWMAEFSAGGDLGDIADGFLAAFGILRKGWSLFDQRCEAPVKRR